MLNKKYFFIFATFFGTFIAIAMEQELQKIIDIVKPQSIASLNNRQVAVAGENGCGIFDAQSRKLIRSITDDETLNIAANRDRTVLALSTTKEILFHDIHSGNQKSSQDIIGQWNVFAEPWQSFIVFTPENQPFLYHQGELFTYNNTYDSILMSRLPLNGYKTFNHNYISCHPTKNEILYMSDSEELSIAQLEYNASFYKTKLKTNFRCVSGDYAPDGHTIAIFNSKETQGDCFICDLESPENPLPAYQLIANNQNYHASTFHPKFSLIFLLSDSNRLHCFDYNTRTLIAITDTLAYITLDLPQRQRKRLDCDPEGKQIAIAFDNSWRVIDIPQKYAFYAIWRVLHQTDLPKELRMRILHNVLEVYNRSYAHFNLKALLDTTPIQPAKPEEKTEDPMVVETEIKQIEAHYVRPMVIPTPKYYGWDHPGNFWAL